jgi:PPOX class probable F420-dependent enzyme
MPSRRALIRMSPDEVEAFVREGRTMNVATFNHDGTIHLVAMWYGFLDGAPAFETFAKSQKIQNLRRDPRITCLIETGDSYDQLKGVELVGTGEVVDDPGLIMVVARDVVQRYYGVSNPDELETIAQAMARKRSCVKVNVDRVVSWDHTKLGGGY